MTQGKQEKKTSIARILVIALASVIMGVITQGICSALVVDSDVSFFLILGIAALTAFAGLKLFVK